MTKEELGIIYDKFSLTLNISKYPVYYSKALDKYFMEVDNKLYCLK